MREIGNEARQETGRGLNSRAENSHLLLRRRCSGSRQMRSLQALAAVHLSVHNPFSLERHLFTRSDFKANRDAALAGWRELSA